MFDRLMPVPVFRRRLAVGVTLLAVALVIGVVLARDSADRTATATKVIDVGGLHVPFPARWELRGVGVDPGRDEGIGIAADGRVTRLDVRYGPQDAPVFGASRAVAGVPAVVDRRAPRWSCPTARVVASLTVRSRIWTIAVCSNDEHVVDAILDGAYFDRPARKGLGIVTGRLLVVGGPNRSPQVLHGALTNPGFDPQHPRCRAAAPVHVRAEKVSRTVVTCAFP